MSRRKQRAREQIAALDDHTLDVLMALIHLLGVRRRWPIWAHAALAEAEADADVRTEFGRLLRRAWPRVDWRSRAHLRTLAGALGVPVPQERRRTRKPPNRQQPVQRTRWPGAAPAPRPGAKRTAGAPPVGAAGDAGAQHRAQAVAARANADPDTWQSAHTLSEALHEDHGWG